jgi:adenine-specific DNA-methyltransferase
VKDAKAEDLTRQPEQIKAFRDTWELGIHSYLTYLRDRLAAARDLLTESGSIFVQIGDENVHLVRSLMDEVFGAENFCGIIVYQKTGGFSPSLLALNVDFIVWYAKSRDEVKYRQMYEVTNLTSEDTTFFDFVELPDGSRRTLTKEEKGNPRDIPRGARILSRNPLMSDGYIESLAYEFPFDGKTFWPSGNTHWKTTKTGMDKLRDANRLIVKGNTLRFVRYLADFPVKARHCLWTDTGTGGFVGDDKTYIVQTDTRAIARCLLMTTDPGDLVLDPTCGSGTTAYIAEQWGRRWITIDTSRVALALARTRLMAARFPYYLLADSAAGRKKQAELSGVASAPREAVRTEDSRGADATPLASDKTRGADATPLAGSRAPDLHKGFVYRTVPHVTLKSIANNPDIKEGMTREEIDKAIARHAETETLYDQPYEDKNVVRVSGPFTVESLSPHRALPRGADATPLAGNFLSMILDNLRKAGVKGTDKRQRMSFARLDPFPGEYIQAEGEVAEQSGVASAPRAPRGANATPLAVRVSVGPEFGTVGDADIKKAALGAIKGSRCDLLLVCAFAFEASVHEQTAELTKEIKLGKLAILPVRMNPDLAMGDELLKKTGAGNLFTVFGEPDVIVSPTRERGQLTVTIRGVDVFDPTTGAVRTGDTDDIACWFIDTDYDGQSFFVRHAYFLYGGKGTADGPYDKLKKALRAEIDEGEWSKLYSATSQPFDPPQSGKIAVKVINHFGDEVLKVYAVPLVSSR